MKRSEMIAYLRETFESEVFQSHWSSSQFWSAILQKLEDKGMLPPERDKWIEGHQCTVNEWEEE